MGYLKSVSIYSESKDIKLGAVPRSVEHHFIRNLKGCKIPKVTQINIKLSMNKTKGTIEQFGSILDYYSILDFEQYKKQTENIDKKKFILNLIYQNLKDLFSEHEWDISKLTIAYEKCLEQSLQNNWYFKNKLFPSADRRYYFALQHCFDIDKYEIFEVIFNSAKSEIARRLAFVDTSNSFCINWASWESNDEFLYKYDGPKKQFICKIKELIDGVEYSLPKRTSDYFK